MARAAAYPAAGYAILSGLLGAAIAEPLTGALTGDFVQLAAIGALLVFAVTAATIAIQLLLGIAGTLVAMIAFVLLGNPSSGGVFPPEFLPGFWRAIVPWLPNVAAFTLVRNTMYFGVRRAAARSWCSPNTRWPARGYSSPSSTAAGPARRWMVRRSSLLLRRRGRIREVTEDLHVRQPVSVLVGPQCVRSRRRLHL
jgi:hypothetical protein